MTAPTQLEPGQVWLLKLPGASTLTVAEIQAVTVRAVKLNTSRWSSKYGSWYERDQITLVEYTPHLTVDGY